MAIKELNLETFKANKANGSAYLVNICEYLNNVDENIKNLGIITDFFLTELKHEFDRIENESFNNKNFTYDHLYTFKVDLQSLIISRVHYRKRPNTDLYFKDKCKTFRDKLEDIYNLEKSTKFIINEITSCCYYNDLYLNQGDYCNIFVNSFYFRDYTVSTNFEDKYNIYNYPRLYATEFDKVIDKYQDCMLFYLKYNKYTASVYEELKSNDHYNDIAKQVIGDIIDCIGEVCDLGQEYIEKMMDICYVLRKEYDRSLDIQQEVIIETLEKETEKLSGEFTKIDRISLNKINDFYAIKEN